MLLISHITYTVHQNYFSLYKKFTVLIIMIKIIIRLCKMYTFKLHSAFFWVTCNKQNSLFLISARKGRKTHFGSSINREKLK